MAVPPFGTPAGNHWFGRTVSRNWMQFKGSRKTIARTRVEKYAMILLGPLKIELGKAISIIWMFRKLSDSVYMFVVVRIN